MRHHSKADRQAGRHAGERAGREAGRDAGRVGGISINSDTFYLATVGAMGAGALDGVLPRD